MVEMLVAAFILAVGILGLTLLQAMSAHVATGGHTMEMAVQLAEQVMDQAEAEGRVTYLNANITNQQAPGALSALAYINQASVTQYYAIDTSTGKPTQLANATGALYTVQMSQTLAAGTGLSDVQVQVQFSDSVNGITGRAIPRSVTLTRRILHG